MLNKTLISKKRRNHIQELVEDFKCEYSNYTQEQVEDYTLICDLNPVELLYFLELLD